MFQAATIQVQTVSRPAIEPRNAALDGFRGLMTIFVLVSHYLGEVPHGLPVFEVGWIAVIAFFVLSGFLVGRLILEKQDRANFFTVFYVRRACRTLPVYFVCVLVVFACIRLFARAHWLDVSVEFPLWSYLTFTQNAFVVMTGSIGAHWLAPTWTLAVEEQFYLITPALFFFAPRRRLPAILLSGFGLSILYRIWALKTGVVPDMALFVLIPGVTDTLTCGLLAALLITSDKVNWRRYDLAFRLAPLVLLYLAIGLRFLDGADHVLFRIAGVPMAAVASALFIVSLARGKPEGARLTSPVLCFFGRTSYSIYLTHLTVLGLLHGLVFAAQPDISSPARLLVTLAALPIAVLVGWLGTVVVEQPITAYGRSWAWSRERRARRGSATVSAGAVSPA